MKAKILITYANQYSLDGSDGKTVAGTTLNYFFTGDNLELFKTKDYTDTMARGVNRAKGNVPFEMFHKITKVPAVYEAITEMSIAADGKPTIKLVDVDYLADCELVVSANPKK